jgi:hypothetical protein
LDSPGFFKPGIFLFDISLLTRNIAFVQCLFVDESIDGMGGETAIDMLCGRRIDMIG